MKLKPVFQAQANKTGTNFMVFILMSVGKLFQFDAIHDFFSMAQNRFLSSGYKSVQKPYWNSYLVHRIIDSCPRILKQKIIRLKPVLWALKGLRPVLKKLTLFFIIFTLVIMGKCNTRLHMTFSVWLRTGSYPADINWFGSHIVQLFIASYYRQLSADIKMEYYKIKTSFVGPEGPKTCAKKLTLFFMILILLIMGKCL